MKLSDQQLDQLRQHSAAYKRLGPLHKGSDADVIANWIPNLLSDLEECKRDAERYQWCKNFPDSAASIFDNLGPAYFDSEIDMLKSQTDAALSAKEKSND